MCRPYGADLDFSQRKSSGAREIRFHKKKVERRGSGRRCEVCRMSPGQQSVDRSLPFLIGILKGKRGVSIAYFWGASRAAAAVDG